MSLLERWRTDLDRLHQDGSYRSLRAPCGHDFSSNDYLGFSQHVWPASDLSRSGTASRLLRGQQPIWEEVEARLADWHRAEAALMFTSGYTANEGLLSTIVSGNDHIFSDACNHASLIDGVRLSRAEKSIYRHLDLDHLEVLLRGRHAHRGAQQAWFIVTESLFGMEGDIAPLREMADLAERHHAHLIVDEAHATGCFGAQGSGLVDAMGLRSRVLATVHTGGKALAVPGAYVAGAQLLKDYLVNRCRHLIFTTALPSQIGSWWLDALQLVKQEEAKRSALHERAGLFRRELLLRNIEARGNHYLFSLTLGSDAEAVAAAQRLQEMGFDVRAIRPPTVPVGTARLRISIHADHEPELLRELANALAALP